MKNIAFDFLRKQISNILANATKELSGMKLEQDTVDLFQNKIREVFPDATVQVSYDKIIVNCPDASIQVNFDYESKNHYMLQFFKYEHLPAHLQTASAPFGLIAQHIVDTMPDNPERTAGLRKLIEAKDCIVRSLLFKNEEPCK